MVRSRGGFAVSDSPGAGIRRSQRTEVEFVLVVGVDQAVFYLGFAVGDLGHEVVVLGLALLKLGPVAVAEMSRALHGLLGG